MSVRQIHPLEADSNIHFPHPYLHYYFLGRLSSDGACLMRGHILLTELLLRLTSQSVLDLLSKPTSKGLCPIYRDIDIRSRNSTCKAKLIRHTLDAMRRVDILDQSDLVTGSAALPRDDRRIGEEILPYLCSLSVSHNPAEGHTDPEPSLPILGFYFLSVTNPISIPSPQGS